MRACQAALAMVQSSRENGITLRVGIHSGEIVAGLPDKFTKEQSVYGAAVHLASRLEHMAQPGDICVTESTFKLVQSHCEAVRWAIRTSRDFHGRSGSTGWSE